ncbi:hypothetical protein ADIAG_00908 [Paeniglutamicibacter gangotriensis Lz1y]|uniref:Uncharacterized protein n=1 Tax=Paeniglutamicibacter gangotriensis Lz1y TaxID=1276920 RepID=M7MXY4_9MICC|nr:hypothetical protein ADIAG_00908 [Paeniglutamicibacter gangotriensis Lz1y]
MMRHSLLSHLPSFLSPVRFLKESLSRNTSASESVRSLQTALVPIRLPWANDSISIE